MKLRSLSFILAFVGSVLFNASASSLIPSVSNAQEWLNRTYTSNPTFMFKPMPINGVAGTNTFNSFVHALQIELGITPEQSDSGRAYGRFGELTRRLCPVLREGAEDTSKNLIKLLQYALVCKGYYMGPVIGKFGAGTSSAINKLKSDAFGVTITDSTVDPMWMKAILNSDAYHMRWISNGDGLAMEMEKLELYNNI